MIHTFKEDFYGQILSVVMVGYIRPERGFDSLGKVQSVTNVTTQTNRFEFVHHTLNY